jgi:hypothetical protein
MSGADASPSRQKSEKQLGDVSSVLQMLKDEVAFLQDEVERKGAGFYGPLAKAVGVSKDSLDGLIGTLNAYKTGLDAKDADQIPSAAGVSETKTSESDIGKSIRTLQATVNSTRFAYQQAAVASKKLVEDADKLDIVVKACQTEYIKLKLLNNNAKAYVNAKRLRYQRQADSFRYWAEFVHFETIGAIQREMEDLTAEQEEWEKQHQANYQRAQDEFDRMNSGQKRIKCMMLLKKMKNSRLQATFATWDDYVQNIRWERMEAEKAALLAELQARFGHLSADEIERKLRQFMKRWINRKMLGPWACWKTMWRDAAQRRLEDELAAERARLAAEMAAMQNNIAIKKLKMHFAKIAGMLKNMCFKALVVKTNQAKTMRMLEGEAGQRLKAFLASKLASTLRKCYQAIIVNHRRIEAENMKNNENAKKVGLLLEKIARGIVHRCFSAFNRYYQSAVELRAAESALAGRLSQMDELNKAKLRVFLDAKRLGKMSTFFKHWANIAQNAALIELYEMLEKEEALRKAAEEELARLMADSDALAGGVGAVEAEIEEANQRVKQAEAQFRALGNELRSLGRKIKELEADLEAEKEARAEGAAKLAALRAELAKLTAVRDEMAAELGGIAGEVGHVHQETKYDEE